MTWSVDYVITGGGNGQATYASIIPLSKSTNALESETRSLNYSYYVLDKDYRVLYTG